jgi:hypothetical protein
MDQSFLNQNPAGGMGQSLASGQFSGFAAQEQQSQVARQASMSGSQLPGFLAEPQIPRPPVQPDLLIQTMVNQQMRGPLLQALNLPLYPAPPDNTPRQPQPEGDLMYRTALTEIARNIHLWTRMFDVEAAKPLNMEDQAAVESCLDTFGPMQPGLVMAFNTGQLSIEGLYYSPSYRRFLVEHIIALHIQIFISHPFFPGVDISVGKLLNDMTDRLYRNRTFLFFRGFVDRSYYCEP